MTRTSLQDVTCSIARTVDILGDAWSWLIVRDVFLGVSRFDDLCADIGISRKVLAERLRQLTESGVIIKDMDATTESRPGYRLTEKGEGLVPVLAAIMAWGDRWEPTPGGPPLRVEHADCGIITVEVTCSHCGEPLTAQTLTARTGPGGSARPGTALLGGFLCTATDSHT